MNDVNLVVMEAILVIKSHLNSISQHQNAYDTNKHTVYRQFFGNCIQGISRSWVSN